MYEIRTLQLPLTSAPWMLLRVPYPMTDNNWEQMLATLEVMKAGLVEKEEVNEIADVEAGTG